MNQIRWNEKWLMPIKQYLENSAEFDAGHDMAHLQRVVNNATKIAMVESADLMIVLPAAWLHDCVCVPKNSPLRSQASQLAAEQAVQFLQQINYPSQYLDGIAHAITAHSFSANIPPETLEAKVVQDADRLDALGAIGLARCIAIGVQMGGRALYHTDDPFGQDRPYDDKVYAIDHFFCKLFSLADTMQTADGRAIAEQRTAYLHQFLAQLGEEIGVSYPEIE